MNTLECDIIPSRSALIGQGMIGLDLLQLTALKCTPWEREKNNQATSISSSPLMTMEYWLWENLGRTLFGLGGPTREERIR